MTVQVHEMGGPAVVWPLLAVSAVFLGCGVLIYAGVWTGWAVRGAVGRREGIVGVGWFGFAGCLVSLLPGVSRLGPGSNVVLPLFTLVAVVCMGVGMLAPFWVWNRLLPRWYRRWVALGRPVRPAGARRPGWYVPAIERRTRR
jgi:hypothetical protein